MNETKFMKRALQLAKLGEAEAAPNPMVGAVIVCDGVIIGEGFHQKCGGPHAEVNAVNSVLDKELLAKSTIYVTLEPCSHWGKTPPCADLIIDSKIKKVVIGTIDPFSQVSGRGVQKLKDAGIEVITGVLEDECVSLNAAFFTFHTKKRPYIILKWAQSSDGYIGAKIPSSKPLWFTNYACRVLVHKQRAHSGAVMVGSDTVVSDNPELTVRAFVGKNPLRVTIDRDLKLSDSFNFFDNQAPSLLFTSPQNLENAQKKHPNTKILPITSSMGSQLPVQQVVDSLYTSGVQSLIVEGGAKLLGEFITAGLWDAAYIYTGAKTLAEVAQGEQISDRVAAPRLSTKNCKVFHTNIEHIALEIVLIS